MAGKSWAIAPLLLLAMAAPALAEGQLSITSVPSGATVLLEGQYAGETPVLLDAPAGRYRMQVRMKGRGTQSFTARVADGLTTRRTVRLVQDGPRTGELRIVSDPPGAQLYLDGTAIGSSPRLLRGLPPGRYRIGAVREGYRTTARWADVHAGLTSSLALSLPVLPPPAPVRAAPKPVEPKRPVAAPPRPAAQPVHRPRTVWESARPRRHVPAPVPLAAEAPATPIAPPTPPAPGLTLDPRAWLFWGLMLLTLAGLARHMWRTERRRRASLPTWYPAQPGRLILPWPGPGVLDPASQTAIAAMSLGRWQAGADALWRILETTPGTAWHYYHLGLANQFLGRAWEAETAYRTAIQLDPSWDAPHLNLARLLEATHQPAEAVIAYRRLLLAQPDHSQGHFNLGHLYVELGMTDHAIVTWQAARKLAPRDPALKTNLRALMRRVQPARPTWRFNWAS